MRSDESLSGATLPPAAAVFSARGLISLWLRPRAYFANPHVLQDRRGILVAALLVGVTNAMDRIDRNLVKTDLGAGGGANSFTAWVVSSWSNYWLMVLVAGVISAVLSWYIYGWWYRKRLEWSGAAEVEREDARRLNTLQELVYVLPLIALAVWQTLIYRNYAEAWASDDMASMVIVVFLFWSCWTSYCGATTLYTLKKARARFWFLILPALFYLLVMGVFGGLYATRT